LGNIQPSTCTDITIWIKVESLLEAISVKYIKTIRAAILNALESYPRYRLR
jgi:hypothetical protein